MREMSERGTCGQFWWALDPVNNSLSTLSLQSQEHSASIPNWRRYVGPRLCVLHVSFVDENSL